MTWGEFKRMVESRGAGDDSPLIPRFVREAVHYQGNGGSPFSSVASYSYAGSLVPPTIDIFVETAEESPDSPVAVVLQMRQPDR